VSFQDVSQLSSINGRISREWHTFVKTRAPLRSAASNIARRFPILLM
jgi:hypothetical protein